MLPGYIGQRDRLSPLIAAIEASRVTGRPLPHMLLLGRPGTGKTELAKAIAAEMQLPFAVLHGPSVSDRADVGNKVMEAQGGFLFIDEVHALPRQMAEDAYTLLDEDSITVQRPIYGQGWQWQWIEDESAMPESVRHQWRSPGVYEIPVGKDTGKTQPERIKVDALTIIGATTDEALLPAAFLSRLSRLVIRLRPYSEEELATIADRHAWGPMGIGAGLAPSAAKLIAARSRNSPRRAKFLTERAVDFAITGTAGGRPGIVLSDDVEAALTACGVDEHGLDEPHRQMLAILKETGGVSRTSLAQRMGVPARNMEAHWADLAEMGLVTIDRRHQLTEAGVALVAA